MPFRGYTGKCVELRWELIESLTDSEVDELREDCTTLGKRAWRDWVAENTEDILAFVAAPPSLRAKKKKWCDPVVRKRLVLAGIQHLARAYNLLASIEENFLFPGLSYREFASTAGYVYADILYNRKVEYWPFVDPNPFGFEWMP